MRHPQRHFLACVLGGCASLSLVAGLACSTNGSNSGGSNDAASASGDDADGSASTGDGGASGDDGTGGGKPKPVIDAGVSDAGFPAGWLYTSGAKIYESNGSAPGTPWMGRGVNVDDIFFCGYNNTLYMTSPDKTLETIVSGLMSAWKPTFVRISLGMNSYPTVTSWLSDAAQYKTPMTGVINALGANPGVHVLVTLRSDTSMTGPNETTDLPTDTTDPTYVALVDTFANSGFVLFGLSNEPGGNSFTIAKISAAMSHAVGVIRAEEDKLGVPHHIISVQGENWTSNISSYATAPLPYDNLVYEVHGYPPLTASYTYANIPVILGEYGTLSDSTTFYADLEAKQIPNLAWDFEPYGNCAPDLLNVNQSATNLSPTAWGTTVKTYLLAH
jgi:hypothetical protein